MHYYLELFLTFLIPTLAIVLGMRIKWFVNEILYTLNKWAGAFNWYVYKRKQKAFVKEFEAQKFSIMKDTVELCPNPQYMTFEMWGSDTKTALKVTIDHDDLKILTTEYNKKLQKDNEEKAAFRAKWNG